MRSRHQVTFSLLEDLHTGTGVGSAAVDALLARDCDDQPCLFWSHLKGVLRSNAVLLADHGAIHTSVDQMFGRPNADAGGSIVLTSAWAASGAQVQSIVHASVARRLGSRAPLDDSLRMIEFVPANTCFTAQVELPDALLDDFRRVLSATDCLGADRRRGDGLVHVAIDALAPQVGHHHEVRPGSTLRLLLRALDPISMPNTSDPSSSRIQGECFIRGQTLAGAFAAACFDTHYQVSRSIFDRTLGVSDALPLPVTDAMLVPDLDRIEILPAPRHYRLDKAPSAVGAQLPWWVAGEPMPLKAGMGWRHDDVFIWRQGDDDWQWYQARTRQRLRLQVPSAHNSLAVGEPQLFAQHEILERTLFLAELAVPNDPDTASALQAWLQGASWLRVGRGARPVEVLSSTVTAPVAQHRPDESSSKRHFLLASDLILRDSMTLETLPWVRPDEAEKLAAAVGAASVELTQALRGHDVHGFNGISRLPRQPEYALSRGAVFTAIGPVAAAAGERAHEGYGRIVPLPVDLVPPGEKAAVAIQPFVAKLPAAVDAPIETAACIAEGLFENVRKRLGKTSRSARSTLRLMMVTGRSNEDVLTALRAYSRPGTLRADFGALHEVLDDYASAHPDAPLADLAAWILDWSLAQDRDDGEAE